MWLLNKISCEIQILNEKVGKLMIENSKLEEEIKKLEIDKIHWRDLYWEECEKNKKLKEENKKLRSNIEFLHSGEGYSCMERVEELKERIRFLEQCLDNKEKVNKSLREEIEWYHGFDNYLTNHGFDMKNLKEKLKNQN